MGNVFVHQDFIKWSTLITPSLAKNALLNASNVRDQLFVSTVMLQATD